MAAFNYKNGQIPREEDNVYSFENSKTFLKLINKNFEFKNGNGASRDSFITNNNYVNYVMSKKENIDDIGKETWSVANVCNKNKIDFVSFKVISDLINKPSSEDQFKINHVLCKISRNIRT